MGIEKKFPRSSNEVFYIFFIPIEVALIVEERRCKIFGRQDKDAEELDGSLLEAN